MSAAFAFSYPRTELAVRQQDGASVTLFWTRGTNVLAVEVVDHRNGDSFECVLEPDERPLDVFYHPYAYAAARGLDLMRSAILIGWVALAASGCSGGKSIIPLKQTAFVKRGDHLAPTCEHGTWTFAGADFKRKASKWRCPTGECQPKSLWRKASRMHPLIPHGTTRWRSLYRGRASVEREFGRLKNEYGLAPLRVRGLKRVALHADLVMLARLSQALSRARAVPLAA